MPKFGAPLNQARAIQGLCNHFDCLICFDQYFLLKKKKMTDKRAVLHGSIKKVI